MMLRYTAPELTIISCVFGVWAPDLRAKATENRAENQVLT